MTTIHLTHANFPQQHQGAERLSNASEALQALGSSAKKTAILSSMLLAAVVTALVVVAEQVMSSLEDGHLLMSWIAMWAVIFVGLALFAGTARRGAVSIRQGWKALLANDKDSTTNQLFLGLALNDPSIVAQLHAAGMGKSY